MAEKLTTLAKRLRPFIIGQAAAAAAAGGFVNEGPGIDVIGNYVGLGGDTILHYDALWSPVAEFAPSDAGLALALAAVSSGDALILPAGTIALTSRHTLPDEISVIGFGPETCVFDLSGGGEIALGNLSILHNLTVDKTLSSAATIYGVEGPTVGTGYIDHCWIIADNAGAGNAYGIGAINGITALDGNIDARYSYLYGASTSGDGYAGRSTRGVIYSRWNQEYGSTDRWVLV